jgi:AcrR family transcriptional regulator
MTAQSSPPRSGRRAEAKRNDERVLRAAREVLIASADAPMSQIARRAGVGMGTLYRRYPSKEALVAALCLDGMRALEDVARAALERVDEDPWAAFAGFMAGGLDAGAGALGASLAGTFTPTEELMAASQSMHRAITQLLQRAQAAGAVRDDVTPEDLGLIFEQLRAVALGDERRIATLQRRYLELALQGLRAPAPAPLPGPAPGWREIRRRWTG